jgi:hypothetical protein
MSTTTKALNGALLLYDDSYLYRWLDALGENVIKYNLTAGDLDDITGYPAEWVCTATGTSPITRATTAGQVMLITTQATEYNGQDMQVKGSAFSVTSGDYTYMRCKCTLSHATQSDLLLGLCVTKSDNIKRATAHGITATGVEGLFFWKADGATTIYCKSYKDGAETGTATLTTAMDTDAHDFEIMCDGTSAYFLLDNAVVATLATSLPDSALTPTVCLGAGDGNARTLNIAALTALQLR